MSANSSITNLTLTNGETKRISTFSIESVIDTGTYRVVKTFLPTNRYRSSDSLAAIKAESGSLFSATEAGVSILLSSLIIENIIDFNGVCQIILQGGRKITLDETVSVIEARIDALGDKPALDQTEQTSIFIKAPEDGTEKVILKAAYPFTITEVTTISTSGTCTLAVSINATALGGSSNSVSTSEVSQAHSTDNSVAIGDDVSISISSNASCENLNVSLTGVRTLA